MYKQLSFTVFFLVVIAFTFFMMHRMRQQRQESGAVTGRTILQLLFIWYLCAVAAVTVIPLRATPARWSEDHVNFTPVIRSIHRWRYVSFVHDRDGIQNFKVNLVGNIIMFMPFGFFLALLYRKRIGGVLIVAAAASICIETLQALNMLAHYYRYVDIDDVILNTSGAALGYLVFLVYRNARKNTGI